MSESKKVDHAPLIQRYIKALKSTNEWTRATAVNRLWGSVRVNEEARAACMIRLRDKSSDVRIQAACALTGLCEDHPDVRALVLDRLAKERDFDVFSALLYGIPNETRAADDVVAIVEARAAQSDRLRAIVREEPWRG